MGNAVWGTFSVRDHCRSGAFVHDALMFDRLVIPYPDVDTPGEWERWRHPNPHNPEESWAPERLDTLLEVLGTSDAPGYNGAQLAQKFPWSPQVWDEIKTNLQSAKRWTGNPWYDTALGVMGGVPEVVESVASYPSEDAWRRDVQPEASPNRDRISAMEAVLQLPRPLLVPPPDGNEIDTLRRVVDLALDPEFRMARSAYFDWFRDFIEPLRAIDAAGLAEVTLDQGSFKLAQEKLHELWNNEVQIVRKGDRRRWFSRVEVGCVSVSAAASVGVAVAAALPVLGVGVAVLTFGGWAFGRLGRPDDPRSVGGATMFVQAQRQLGWLEPDLR